MLKYSVFLVLSVFVVVMGHSLLTPQQHVELNGFMFCAHSLTDPNILPGICREAARREGFSGYYESHMQNLSCKTGADGYVLLDPGNGGEWEYVEDSLLECTYQWARANIATRTFGRGKERDDVFQYKQDPDRNNAYIVESLRDGMLTNLIPPAPPRQRERRERRGRR
ncbi:uncharacterized protein LOC135849166 [Planococcus citri]|uniref:uncharacterized protein LOC135849166 n=1 Tax=Planococcus citri TaxID=170843 RepID=UPI0031F73F79